MADSRAHVDVVIPNDQSGVADETEATVRSLEQPTMISKLNGEVENGETNGTSSANGQPDLDEAINGAPEPDGEAKEDFDHGIISHEPPAPKKKKRKNKTRSAGKSGLGKPTGFEDFFADAPLTPEEYAEEQDLYHADLQFVDRVLTAIARFERTRKLTPERRNVLYKYLAFGGLTVGPNYGQGGLNTENLDKNQIAQALSQVFVSDDKRDLNTPTALYDVDFLGCVKGFLSRRAKNIFGLETKEVCDLVCSTLERFMDYLLQHDVCPDYVSEIMETRAFLRTASVELWDLTQANVRLPGDFNIACSTLFGGSFARPKQDASTTEWWAEEPDTAMFETLKPEEAQRILKFGVVGAAPEKVYQSFLRGVNGEDPTMLQIIDIKENTGLEITKIEAPTKLCKAIHGKNNTKLRPMGRVYAKRWQNPDAAPEDLTEEERIAGKVQKVQELSGGAESEYVFFMEAILQVMLRVGTRIEATVRTLRCGITFFDKVLDTYPSFDEFLANELMVDWTRPRPKKGALDYVSGEDDDDEQDGDEDGDAGEGKEKQNGKKVNFEETAAEGGVDSKEGTTGEKIGAVAKEALSEAMSSVILATDPKRDTAPSSGVV